MPPQEKFVDSQQQEDVEMANTFTNKAFEPDCKGEEKNSKQVAEVKESFDFDDLLPHIGEFGLYQKLMFLMMIPFAFFVAWVYFTQIFITITPDKYWCKVPELEHLSKEERLVLWK